MPEHLPQSQISQLPYTYNPLNMAKTILDLSGRGGIAPRGFLDLDRVTSTPNLRYLGGESQVASGIYNPFRTYGYMSPANNTFTDMTLASGSMDTYLASSIYDIINDDFYFADNTEIFKGDGLDDTSVDSVKDLGSTGTPVISDLEIYQVNGVRKLFYVYEKGGNMDIGIATLPFASADDTWLTSTVSGAFTNGVTGRPFMRLADNGFAYIFQDNVVHKIDGTTDGGTNGTVYPNLLKFPIFFQITDALDYKGNMFMAIRQDTKDPRTVASEVSLYNAPVGIYVWDRLTNVVRLRDYIPIEGVKSINKIYVAPNGELRLITTSSERTTQIRRYNGSSFEVIEEVGPSAGPNVADGLQTVGNSVIWLAQDGGIYAHGRPFPRDNEGLFKIGAVPDTLSSGTASTGAILFGGASTNSGVSGYKAHRTALYMGYTTSGGTNRFKTWDIYGTGADGVEAAGNQGDVYTLVRFLPKLATVNHITIYCAPGASTGATAVATVKVYFNQSSTPFKTYTVTRNDNAKGFAVIPIQKPYVNAVQLEIEFTTGVTLGAEDFRPAFAEIDYSPTNTLK